MSDIRETHPGTRSRLDPQPMPRRDFLGQAAIWSALGALVFGLIGVLRLPKAAVLSSPSKKFRVNLPQSLAPGTPFVPPGRAVAIFRDKDGVYAISTVCTHLGCIVAPTASGFSCPCHGSRFDRSGEVLRGPAPKALGWLSLSTADGLEIMVNEGQRVPTGTKVRS